MGLVEKFWNEPEISHPEKKRIRYGKHKSVFEKCKKSGKQKIAGPARKTPQQHFP
jgi:hypothetical protein